MTAARGGAGLIAAADLLARAEALPPCGLDALLPAGGALVLAPHPDDESLGCGGLLALLAAAGRPARVVLVSDGAASHPCSRSHPPARLRAVREAETLAALAELGHGPEALAALGLPDGAVPGRGPGFDAAAAAVANLARRGPAPGAVFAAWGHDPHPDHAATDALARAVAAELALPLISYPVWGLRHLHPHALGAAPPLALPPPARAWRLDVAAALTAKRRAVAAHASQTTALVADAPSGFRLTPAMLAIFLRPFELYLEAPR